MKFKPITLSEFNQQFLCGDNLKKEEILKYFEPTIQELSKLAIGPYYWLIPDQANMTLIFASPNTAQLSPYTPQEWIGKNSMFWIESMHPEDREFVLTALSTGLQFQESAPMEKANKINFSMYCRIINENSEYRWCLLQFPHKLYSQEGKVISSIIQITDLSHLPQNFSRMMTLIDSSNNEQLLFATRIDKILKNRKLPAISKREMEILQLMARGLNTPQMAEALFLSYHTIENHKRNLRKKTLTKTSAELINYVCVNNMF